MPSVRFSSHALTNLTEREIDRAEVERTIAEPDAIESGHGGRQVYMRRYYDAGLAQDMLLRVIVEVTAAEIFIVTVYKTSQFERYLKGRRP